jgi:hypothetical protein
MRTRELISLVIGVALFFVVNLRTSFAQDLDIEACITAQNGDDHPPIIIFDSVVSVGDTVRAHLCKDDTCTGQDQRDWWDDFMPTYSQCPGYNYWRDADASIISRITPHNAKDLVIIFARHAGGRGNNPGSEGYVKILNPEWKITRFLGGTIGHSEYGDGVEVDRQNGIVRWSGRYYCPYCACLEVASNIAFLVEKTDKPVTSQGDWNCDGLLNLSDVIGLANYLLKGGPGPACQLYNGDSLYLDF